MMQDLLDVTAVQARNDHTLLLRFENGEQRLFDMKPLLSKKPFEVLAQLSMFERVRLFAGSVAWPGDIDIAPETLYERSVAWGVANR